MKNFYINLIPSDPRNDCRPVWPEYMVRDAIAQITTFADLTDRLREAKSTAEKLDLIRELKETYVIDLHMLAEMLSEQLATLTKAPT